MGLDAHVACNCYETGKVKNPPPQPEFVHIDPESGEVFLRWEESNADQHRFFEWMASACEHGPLGHLVSHRLGNIATIGFLRTLFSNTPECFPTLLAKVVHNGTHAGDILNLSDVEHLAHELLAVHALHCPNDSDEVILRQFETQLMELVQASRKVSKPIVF